jgi:1-acyl-sn-glycerol-3-phosphate acyltransferase
LMKKFAIAVTKAFFKIFYRVELVNPEKIPAKGPAILCANHNTMLDMFFLGFKLDRWIYWMAKEELFKNPILAYLIRKLGGFPVKRGKGDVASIKTAYRLLEDGNIVGIFPHGTRINAANVNTVRIKSGAAMLAVNSGADIIPAAVQGSYRLFSRMRVIYGEPFKFESGKRYTSEELSELSREIVKKIYALLEEKQ